MKQPKPETREPSSDLVPAQSPSLVAKVAGRYGVDPEKMLATLKATAFRQDGEKTVSNEQMLALLVVADQYRLNPFTKELFAFPDKGGGIVPVVSVDGWIRIINEHPEFDGLTFEFDDGGAAVTCRIFRKDRQHPIEVTEYLAECKRGTAPWNSHPRRMLRHKALIQCARLAFGFGGIHDEDEAQRILEADQAPRPPAPKPIVAAGAAGRLRAALDHVAPLASPTEVRNEAPPPADAPAGDLIGDVDPETGEVRAGGTGE
jgi:hypothetical protein